MKSFIRALGREAESRATALATNRGGETATLYFGGGTPSMLSDTHLGRLMETLDRLVPVDKLDEFSFEANPATFTEKKVRFWRSLGMTRVSLGVQSLDSGILHLLGNGALILFIGTAGLLALYATGSGSKLLRRDMLLGNITAEVRVKPCQPLLFRDALCILPCSNDLRLRVHFTANIRVMPGRVQFIIRYLTG